MAGSARRLRYRNASVHGLNSEGLASCSHLPVRMRPDQSLLDLDSPLRIQVYRSGRRIGVQISVDIGPEHQLDAAVHIGKRHRLLRGNLVENGANTPVHVLRGSRTGDVAEVDAPVHRVYVDIAGHTVQLYAAVGAGYIEPSHVPGNLELIAHVHVAIPRVTGAQRQPVPGHLLEYWNPPAGRLAPIALGYPYLDSRSVPRLKVDSTIGVADRERCPRPHCEHLSDYGLTGP